MCHKCGNVMLNSLATDTLTNERGEHTVVTYLSYFPTLSLPLGKPEFYSAKSSSSVKPTADHIGRVSSQEVHPSSHLM